MVIGWLLVLGAVIGLGITFAGSFQNSGSIPGSPAQVALTKMDRHFPSPTRSRRKSSSRPRPGGN